MGRQTYVELFVSIGLRCKKKEVVEWTYIDYLKAFFEEFGGFGGEVVFDAVFGGLVGLVDVDSFSWAAGYGASVAEINWGATDGVVENKDAGCSSAVEDFSI